MYKTIFLGVHIFVFVAFFGTFFGALETKAQTVRSDGGYIVIDSRALSPTNMQVVFIVAKNFFGATTLQFQTISNEGFVHTHPSLNFPNGLTKGQVVKLWDGEFSVFQSTPWLRFDVELRNSGLTYYTMHMTPISHDELYKEPMIYDISETKIDSNTFVINLNGNFDSYENTRIIINSHLMVLGKSVIFPAPGKMRFTLTDAGRDVFPTGKYLITICQSYHCDTMVGRHR